MEKVERRRVQSEEELAPRRVRFQPKQLFQLPREGMITGVCSGIATYLNVDVRIVRAAFVILGLLTKGGWALVYLVLMVTVPVAKTPYEEASAKGEILMS